MLLLFKKYIFKNTGHKVKEFFKERQAHEEIWHFLSFWDKKNQICKTAKTKTIIFSLIFWCRKYRLSYSIENIQ